MENRVSEHETLKFFFSGVDLPPTGSYFKSFVKMSDLRRICLRGASEEAGLKQMITSLSIERAMIVLTIFERIHA